MSKTKRELRAARKKRIRSRVLGTPTRPRLSVYRSLRYVYAQLIDDVNGKTLASASSINFKAKSRGNLAAGEKVGTELAKAAQAVQIKEAAFDRNGFLYHGVIKSLADAARKGGLSF